MQRFWHIFDKVLDLMDFAAGVILIFITLSVCGEVILRYFFDRPQMWVTEITECLLLYITFLGSAWLLREEGHVKVDMILSRLGPKPTAVLGVVTSLLGSFVSVVLTVYGFKLFWIYLQKGLYTPSAMEIPVSAIIVIIPFGSLALLLQFIRRTRKFSPGCFSEKKKSTI